MKMSDLYAVAFLAHYIDKYGRPKHKLWMEVLTVEPHENLDDVISFNIACHKESFNYTEIETCHKYLGLK